MATFTLEANARAPAHYGAAGDDGAVIIAPDCCSTELRLRFRPAWNGDGVGASLLVLLAGEVWECARYTAQDELKHLGDQWFETQAAEFLCPHPSGLSANDLRAFCLAHNATQGGYKAVPDDVLWRSALDAHSFWAYLCGPKAQQGATLQRMQVMGFERRERRATLRLHAVVRLAEGVLYARMPESEHHFSMRLELVLVA
jgi:hypothetical protein